MMGGMIDPSGVHAKKSQRGHVCPSVCGESTVLGVGLCFCLVFSAQLDASICSHPGKGRGGEVVACLPWAMTSERDARSSGVEVGFAVVDALREKE